MTGGTRIRAIVVAGQQAASDDGDNSGSPMGDPASEGAFREAAPLTPEADEDWFVEPATRPTRDWLPPALALTAIAAWTGFFVWANPELLSGATPQQGVDYVTSWAVPVLLICTVWLIALRPSRREAVRFGDAARLLSDESTRLEARLTVINRELSLAREFLSAESRDLESLGRVASERISQHADRLQSLVRENGAQVDAIAHVSTSALDNMEKLRGQLPVIASSAKDVTNNIANAGRTAHLHVQEMIEGFARINEFGQASDRHVDALRERVLGALDQLGARLGDLHAGADSHLAELDARGAEFRERLESDEVAALAGIRTRSSALLAELEASRQQLNCHEAESITSLRARLSLLRDEGDVLGRKLREGETGAVAALEQSLVRMEEQITAALHRLEALDSEASLAARRRIELLSEEATAFDTRLAERNRQFSIEMEHRAADAAAHHGEEITRLTALLAGLDSELTERRAAHETQSGKLAEHGVAIAAQIEATSARIAAIAAFGDDAERNLGGSLQVLADKLAASRDALAGTDATVGRLTDDSVRLLELLQASTKQSSEGLPTAIASSEGKLVEIESRVGELLVTVERAMERGGELADSVTTTRTIISQSLSEIRLLQVGIEQGAARHGNMLAQLHLTMQDLEK
ncbi:MAG: ATPase, partial [Novosphingobium sp.]